LLNSESDLSTIGDFIYLSLFVNAFAAKQNPILTSPSPKSPQAPWSFQ